MTTLHPILIVLSGGKTAKLPLNLPTIVGRGQEAQLRIPQAGISRRHCVVFESEGELRIRDLGSTDGTYVNDVPIAGETTLLPGDELRFGSVRLCVVYCPPGLSRTAPLRSVTAPDREATVLAENKEKPSRNDPRHLPARTDGKAGRNPSSPTAPKSRTGEFRSGLGRAAALDSSAGDRPNTRVSDNTDSNCKADALETQSKALDTGMELGITGAAVWRRESLDSIDHFNIQSNAPVENLTDAIIRLDVDMPATIADGQIKLDFENARAAEEADQQALDEFLGRLDNHSSP